MIELVRNIFLKNIPAKFQRDSKSISRVIASHVIRRDGQTDGRMQTTAIPIGTLRQWVKTSKITFKLQTHTIGVRKWVNTLRPRQNGRHFQTTFSNAFFSMKMYQFRSRFHCDLFLRVQLTIFLHWFRQWPVADQATSHYLSQWWFVYWRIYASLGLNELKHQAVPTHIEAEAKWPPFCRWHCRFFEFIFIWRLLHFD